MRQFNICHILADKLISGKLQTLWYYFLKLLCHLTHFPQICQRKSIDINALFARPCQFYIWLYTTHMVAALISNILFATWIPSLVAMLTPSPLPWPKVYPSKNLPRLGNLIAQKLPETVAAKGADLLHDYHALSAVEQEHCSNHSYNKNQYKKKKAKDNSVCAGGFNDPNKE